MGTAPRSPAPADHRQVAHRKRIHPTATSTASGRATNTSTMATPNAPGGLLIEPAREHQKAQQQEQPDLRGGGQALVEREHGPAT